jgi:trimeric autotransporter adhesin
VYGQTSLPAADMVFEPFTQKFYATLPASSTISPNSLVTVDPATGTMGTPIAIGLDPGVLGLSDDGQILYVALNGENAIVPFNLATQTAGTRIPLGVDIAKGSLTAADIQVQPGHSGTVVVTLAAGYSGDDGLALIVNGQVVSQYLNEPPNNVYVGGTRFIGSSDVYGWNAGYNSTGILHFVIVGNQLLEAPGISASYGVGTLATDGSNLFDINGQVFSASTGVLVGTINGLGSFPVGPVGVLYDAPSNRLFFTEGPLNTSTEVIDATSLLQVGFSGGPPAITSRLEKWGPDGLAYLTGSYPQTTGSALVQIRSSLFYSSAGSNPLPVMTAFLPTSATVSGPNFVLTVTGSNFVPGAVVRVRGANRTTRYVDSKTLQVDIPASDIAIAGTAKITVVNPAPGGGVSAALSLPIL